MERKKVRLVLIVLFIGCLLYFIGSFLYGIVSIAKKSNNDFSYVDKVLSINPEDSIYFSERAKSDLVIEYSSNYKSFEYLSLYRYKNKYNVLIRKISNERIDLKDNFKVVFDKTTYDDLITYDLSDAYQFQYRIAIDRPHNTNKNLIIDGRSVDILKRTSDSLLIHCDLFGLSLGVNKNYVNEGFYLLDETFYRRPINVELLLFHREEKTYLYILFPDDHQSVPKGILNQLN